MVCSSERRKVKRDCRCGLEAGLKDSGWLDGLRGKLRMGSGRMGKRFVEFVQSLSTVYMVTKNQQKNLNRNSTLQHNVFGTVLVVWSKNSRKWRVLIVIVRIKICNELFIQCVSGYQVQTLCYLSSPFLIYYSVDNNSNIVLYLSIQIHSSPSVYRPLLSYPKRPNKIIAPFS